MLKGWQVHAHSWHGTQEKSELLHDGLTSTSGYDCGQELQRDKRELLLLYHSFEALTMDSFLRAVSVKHCFLTLSQYIVKSQR